jgi:hypothetical protein
MAPGPGAPATQGHFLDIRDLAGAWRGDLASCFSARAKVMDFKYEVQKLAEGLAEDEYGVDFFELSINRQYQVYKEAEAIYVERAADRADQMRKADRENFR